jgi:hypothetical protein
VAGLIFVGVIWRRIRPRRWIREQMVRERLTRMQDASKEEPESR